MIECCCSGSGGGVCTVPIHVKCGFTTSAAVGVSVSLSLTGQPTITHTTDGSGNATFALTAFGVWTITVAPSTGYAGTTTTINASSFNCAGGTWPATFNVSDPPATGYDCNPPGCTTATGCCPGPPYLIASGACAYPSTTYLTDDYGVITMAPGDYGTLFTAGSSVNPGRSWTGSATRTASSAWTGACGSLVAPSTPTTVTVYFQVWCDGTNWYVSAACDSPDTGCSPLNCATAGFPWTNPGGGGPYSTVCRTAGSGWTESSFGNTGGQLNDSQVGGTPALNGNCPSSVAVSFSDVYVYSDVPASEFYALNKIYTPGYHTWGWSA